jgi:hypothetical protein
MVLAPPTLRPGVGAYRVSKNVPIAKAPVWLIELATRDDSGGDHVAGDEPEAEPAYVAAAMAVIPNDDVDWENWNRVCMACWRATGGSEEGFAAFDAWSQKSGKYNAKTTRERWEGFSRSPPDSIGAGTIFWLANKADPDWQQRYDKELMAKMAAANRRGRAEKDKAKPQPEDAKPKLDDDKPKPEDEQPKPDDPQPTPEDDEPKPDDPQPPPADEEVALIDPWERYLVPPFPIDVFPTMLQDYVAAQAEIIGCDPTCIAMNTLATFSGALDHRFALKMMRNSNWCATPRLWTLIVGDPATRKTPSMDAVLLPLKHQDYRIRQDWQRRHKEWEAARRQDRNTELPEPEAPPRYVVNDTTVEKLSEILARSPKGVLVAADEVAGWIGSMERYGNARGMSDRAFWLQAHNGGPYTVDRIKRGEIYVENLSVSILGGIQPERLKEITNLTSDGLLQRFLPVMIREAVFAKDRPIKDEAYGNLIHQMMKAIPTRLAMADDALANMDRLRMHLHDLECVANEVSFGFQSFVGKLPVVCGTFALIFYLIEEILRDPSWVGGNPIQRHMVEKARRLIIDFILPHANEFYSIGGGVHERVRKVASWILANGIEAIIPSDITAAFKAFRHLGGPGANQLMQINLLLSPLVTGGWLWPDDTTPVCRHWRVNPAVHAKFPARAASERARRATLQGLLKRP